MGWWLRRCLPPLLGAVAGLGLSAAFWLPMLLNTATSASINGLAGATIFTAAFVYAFQLFSPHWGFWRRHHPARSTQSAFKLAQWR